MVKKDEDDKSYSRQEIVIQILVYLYNKGSGRLPTDIQEKCSNHSLGYDNVSKILDELWKLKVIDRQAEKEYKEFREKQTTQTRGKK